MEKEYKREEKQIKFKVVFKNRKEKEVILYENQFKYFFTWRLYYNTKNLKTLPSDALSNFKIDVDSPLSMCMILSAKLLETEEQKAAFYDLFDYIWKYDKIPPNPNDLAIFEYIEPLVNQCCEHIERSQIHKKKK
jgi:hypothetical protein